MARGETGFAGSGGYSFTGRGETGFAESKIVAADFNSRVAVDLHLLEAHL